MLADLARLWYSRRKARVGEYALACIEFDRKMDEVRKFVESVGKRWQ